MKLIILFTILLSVTNCGVVDKLADTMLYPFSSLNKKNKDWVIPEGFTLTIANKTVMLHEDAAKGVPVLYLHGNGVDLKTLYEANYYKLFNKMGFDAYSLDYPGVGVAEGVPSEKTLVAAGVEALDYVHSVTGKKVAVWGRSIGSSVAAQVASKRPLKVSSLVLMSPFKDFGSLLADKGGVARLITQEYIDANLYDAMGLTLPMPLLVIHGDSDKLIPHDHGKAVAEKHGATFLSVKDKGHNDLFTVEVLDRVKAHILQ